MPYKTKMRPKRDWCSSCGSACIVVPRRLGSPSGTQRLLSAFCSRRHILQIISLGISLTSSPLRSNLLILFVQTLVASTLLQNFNLASLGRIGRNTSRQDIFGIAHTVSVFSYDQCILDTVASLPDQAAFAKITLLHLPPFCWFHPRRSTHKRILNTTAMPDFTGRRHQAVRLIQYILK